MRGTEKQSRPPLPGVESGEGTGRACSLWPRLKVETWLLMSCPVDTGGGQTGGDDPVDQDALGKGQSLG